MTGFLPLLFALLTIEGAAHAARVPQLETVPFLVVIIAILAGWLAVSETTARLLARRGTRRMIDTWDLIAQALGLAGFAHLCFGWGWAGLTHYYLPALAPWLAFQLIHWWCMAHALGRVRGARIGRFALVLFNLRMVVLPMALLLGVLDVCYVIGNHTALATWMQGDVLMVTSTVGTVVLMVAMLVLFPVALVRLWGARPMAEGTRKAVLEHACAAMGVRVAALLRWPMPGERMYNAAVVGLVPRMRYVLFTDDLLRDFPDHEVLAVLGHELGHARHHHLWLYLVFLIGLLAVSHALTGPIAAGLATMPGLDGVGAALLHYLATLIVFGVGFRVAFGYLSRACERQADLAGAHLAGGGDARAGAATMQAALKNVARLSGQSEDAPSWRHFTIRQRVAFLERIRLEPGLDRRHHRLVGTMRYTLTILVVAMVAAMAVQFYTNPLRRADSAADPGEELARMSRAQPGLELALRRADAGDVGDLRAWLARAESMEIAQFAILHLRLAAVGSASLGIPPLPRTPAIYPYRHRLLPFLHLRSPRAEVDLQIDNLLAYLLVAGTEHPSARDVDLARTILPRLEKALEPAAKPRDPLGMHAIWDTAGCVRFAAGEYARARTAFDQAVTLAELQAKEIADPEAKTHLDEALALYRRRLDAAIANSADAPDRNPLPLPLEWERSQAPTIAPAAASDPLDAMGGPSPAPAGPVSAMP